MPSEIISPIGENEEATLTLGEDKTGSPLPSSKAGTGEPSLILLI